MIATLFILREESGIEYEFPVEITRDSRNDLIATVTDDVEEKRWTTRRGGLELEHTGDYLYIEGDEIDLTDEEYYEAEALLSRLKSDFDREIRSIISSTLPRDTTYYDD
ncbi:hypothetical protein DB345_03840 [Spartobacteria bacterium LR76]|nr:hypothetical protein DB345_03840 [Spartobacteria bacterium LR76]